MSIHCAYVHMLYRLYDMYEHILCIHTRYIYTPYQCHAIHASCTRMVGWRVPLGSPTPRLSCHMLAKQRSRVHRQSALADIIYIYIYIERERDMLMYVCIHMYIYIYIYIYTCICTHICTDTLPAAALVRVQMFSSSSMHPAKPRRRLAGRLGPE